MRLVDYMAPFHYQAVWAVLARMTMLLGGALLVPALVAAALGEWALAGRFAALAGGAWLLGRGGRWLTPTPVDLAMHEALVVSGLSYLLFALVGGLAFLPGAGYLDGLFEAMSGITTTGLSVLDCASLPRSLLFFRAWWQWLGGVGIAVLSLAVLIGPGRSAHQLYLAEVGGENLLGSVVATARVVARVYALLTVAGVLAFLAAGMPFFDALVQALATLSTGGFAVHADSIGHYRLGVGWVVVLFMVLGSMSLPMFSKVGRQGLGVVFRDLQAIWLLTLLALASLWFWVLGPGGPGWAGVSGAVFHAASSLTTTGFSLNAPGGWSDGQKLLSTCLMVVGGAAGSTAGGIKLFRLIVLVKLMVWCFKRLLLPEETTLVVKYGRLTISDQEVKLVAGLVVAHGLLLMFSALLLAAGGFNAVDALFESGSALGTVGLSSGITSPGLGTLYKLLLAFDMWAGRLELIPVALILFPGTWWPRRAR